MSKVLIRVGITVHIPGPAHDPKVCQIIDGFFASFGADDVVAIPPGEWVELERAEAMSILAIHGGDLRETTSSGDVIEQHLTARKDRPEGGGMQRHLPVEPALSRMPTERP